MAPRRQAKQPAAETVAAVADGNVTPPKKRKTAAKSAATNEPKQAAKGRSRQAKAGKRESAAAGEPASPPKKSRSRQKNAAVAAKNETKGKSKKRVNKEPEDAAPEDNAVEKTVEKKARGGKAAAAVKKAGIKATATKPKAKSPAARKPRIKTTIESGAGNSGKQNAVSKSPAKRTTRRMRAAVVESDAPAQPAAKASRKRKNVQDTNEAIPEVESTKEEDEQEEEEEKENEAKVAGKKSRRPKKIETDDARKSLLKFPFR